MADKDIAEKSLEAYNDVFADIVNVLLFNGKEVVKEEELTDAAPNTSMKLENELHEQERDIAKYWGKYKVRLALYGFENQTKVDKAMPLRVLSYDGAAYKAQLSGKEHKQKKYKVYPVITLVLYFGNRHWKGARGLLEAVPVPEELKPYVSDYKINVFEIAWLSAATIRRFKSDFRYVAEFFRNLRLKKEQIFDNKIPDHIDAILKLLDALNNDPKFENMLSVPERRPKTMCDALERLIQQGRDEAAAQLAQSDKIIAQLKAENAELRAKLEEKNKE